MAGKTTRRGLASGCAAILATVQAMLSRPRTAAAAARRRDLPHAADGRLRWVAFYGQLGDEAALSRYDLVVLDPAFAGDLPRVAAGGGRGCAYLSLGEIRRADEQFGRLDPACLLQENPAWPGTWRVDVRHAAWRDFILREKLPAIRARGFTGLMLDTLDTPPWLELIDPARHRGMRDAAVALVQAIRSDCPDMAIIANRGYAILADLCPMIDAVIAESLLTTPVEGGGARWNPAGEVDAQLALLAPARDARPPLPVLALDYWSPADPAGIRQVYARERALGHQPYVAMPSLGVIVPEPDRADVGSNRSGSAPVEAR